MNQNQNPFPFGGGNMPPLGFDQMEKMKSALKRRAAFFGLGLVIVIVAAFLEPKELGLPIYAPNVVMLLGGAVSFMGLLGLSRGAGCMAQIAGLFWFMGLACGVGDGNPLFAYTMAGGALCFAVLGLLLPKKQNPGIPGMPGMGGPGGFPFGGGAPGGGAAGPQLSGKRAAKDQIIEVNAEEKK
jgi:hypothetical protein